MSPWPLALILQLLIVLASLVFGTFFLRIPFSQCLPIVLLVTPVPLFQVSPGAAGFIWSADLLALWFFFTGMWRGPVPQPQEKQRYRTILLLAFLAVIGWPLVSTSLGILVHASRNYKEVALGLARGLAYWVMFRTFILRGLRHPQPHRLLIVQLFALTLVGLCGLWQYRTGIDLDVWNFVRGLDPTRYVAGGYGGGFMGLYRGGVGAWAAGMLAVAPIVLGRSILGLICLPVVFAILMGGVLAAGSRQGFIIGLLGFAFGALGGALAMPPGRKLLAFFRNVAGVLLVVTLAGLIWQAYSPDTLRDWFQRRFEDLLDPQTFLHRAATRDPKMPEVLAHVTSNPHIFFIGAGHGTMVTQLPGGATLDRLYVDSEFFFAWQLGGIVLLVAYAIFLIRLRWAWRKTIQPPDESLRLTITAATAALYVGVLLTYGHFFLLTTDASQAPVAYWNWALFGLAVGATSRAAVSTASPALSPPAPASPSTTASPHPAMAAK